jgi:hypothetical protein
MSRSLAALLLVGLLAPVEAGSGSKPKPMRFRFRLQPGARYTGKNTVSYTIRTNIRQGEKVETTVEEVSRTEHFVDKIVRGGENGITEIRRDYLRLYTKVRDSEKGRPVVHQSPTQQKTVIIREDARRRDVKLVGRGALDPIVRRIVGMEMDWRDIFPEGKITVGDKWKTDATALGQRLAAYLTTGQRSKMRIKYEEVVERDGAKLAKFYVDWTLEGMRDRKLYTKVVLAGDVFFDLKLKRVVRVDLGGTVMVRGAVVGDGPPQIIKGEGPVTVKTTVSLSPDVQPAAD